MDRLQQISRLEAEIGTRIFRRSSPRSIAEQEGPPVILRTFRPEPVTWPVALVWRSDRRQPPAAKAFLAMALDRAERLNGAVPVEIAA